MPGELGRGGLPWVLWPRETRPYVPPLPLRERAGVRGLFLFRQRILDSR